MHPVLLHVHGSFYIGTYGVLIALGLGLAMWIGKIRGVARGYPPELAGDLIFIAAVSGFAGARLLYILQHLSEFSADPRSLLLSRTGFVFLGGFLCALAAVIWTVRRRKLSVLDVSDMLAPSLTVAHAMGRIGCHFAGCCFGGQCKIPGVAIHLPPAVAPDGLPIYNAFLDQLEKGLLPATATRSLGVWPVQLMEAAGLFLMTGLLVWIDRKRRAPGRILGWYLVLYACLRFPLEYLRGDADRQFYAMFSTSQWITLACVPVGVWLLVRKGKE